MKKISKTFVLLSTCLLTSVTPSLGKNYNPPAMGWSSWNAYHININDSVIYEQAKAMKKLGLLKAGYEYVCIDDGYFGGRDENGRLITHPTRFPNGLSHIVEYLHKEGFKAGIYSDAGRNTCGSFWNEDSLAIGVGLYGHDQQDADFFFKELGFDLFKVDYCGGHPGKNSEHLALNEKERYTAISNAIKATGRKDVRMNVCRWDFPGTWVPGVAAFWRMSYDINPSWKSIRKIIHENLYLSAYAGGSCFNDMDMLEIGKKLNQNEEETHFGMWCMMCSPLLIGCDLTTIQDRSLDLLLNKELIEINQAYPAQQAKVVRKEGDAYLFIKDLKKLNGKTRVVAIYNPSDKEICWNLKREDLSLGGNIAIRDAIKQQDVATMKADEQEVSFNVQPHGVRILTLKGAKRIQATRYEAEWAWLNQYQEIWNTGEQIRYIEKENLSTGAGVSFLGNHPDNWMEWRDIYCNKKGEYKLTIHYLSPESRNLSLKANDFKHTFKNLPAAQEVSNYCTINIKLDKGYNTIRLGSENGWAPDIDYIDLELVK